VWQNFNRSDDCFEKIQRALVKVKVIKLANREKNVLCIPIKFQKKMWSIFATVSSAKASKWE